MLAAAVLPWSVRIVPSGTSNASRRSPARHGRAARVLLAALAAALGGTTQSRDDIPADHPPTAGTHGASTIVVDEGRQRVWSVNSDSDTVTMIDAAKLLRLAETSVGDNPRTLAIAPEGTAWVVNQDDATISLVDGGTVREPARIALPYASRPYGIAFSPRGDVAYVTLQATGRLLEINVGDGTVERAVEVGPTPRGVAVSADGRRILVTRCISPADRGVVTEVEARSLKVVRHFDLAVDPARTVRWEAGACRTTWRRSPSRRTGDGRGFPRRRTTRAGGFISAAKR